MNTEIKEQEKHFNKVMNDLLIDEMDEIVKITKTAKMINKYDGSISPYIKESLMNVISQLSYQVEKMNTK